MDILNSFEERFEVGNAFDHFAASEIDLVGRWLPVGEWFWERGKRGLDPYQKAVSTKILPLVEGTLQNGQEFRGVNFASQDYLSLSCHPAIIGVAMRTAEDYGVHSAGSAALMGISDLAISLERELEAFLAYEEVTLFPTGWTAGYGIVKMLARTGDHIVIDLLSHACLQEGAMSSGARVHRFPHLSNEGVRRRLSSIRKEDPSGGILVVTETLFSMDSDSPDIVELQAICREFNATLLVDCAHDLGCLEEDGRGVLSLQGMVGKVDVLIGTFSKTFASIGGFVATQRRGFRTALRACCGPQTFTNAMTPIQASVIREALRIVQADEGCERRQQLIGNVNALRGALIDEGFEVLGQPSAIVPVVIGSSAQARAMTGRMIRSGAIVNLVEAPAVAKNQSRWRLQVMADHSQRDIDRFVALATQARAGA